MRLEGLAALPRGRGGDRAASSWWQAFAELEMTPDARPVPLLRFLEVCAARAVLQLLLSQVTYQLALAIEQTIANRAVEPEGARCAADFRWTGDGDLLGSQLDAKLASYMLTSVVETSGACRLTLSTDKAQVCGLPLQNSFLSLPSGVAIAGPPQAARATAKKHA